MTLENVSRGSGDIGAMLSTCWGMSQVDANSNRLYVENLKARDFQPCGAFVLEGRPHLDRTGQFEMVEAPGAAVELRDYLTRRRGARRPRPTRARKLQRAIEMRDEGSSLREIAATLSESQKAPSVSGWPNMTVTCPLIRPHVDTVDKAASRARGEKHNEVFSPRLGVCGLSTNSKL